MRADRLLSILMLLQTKGRMTAHDLAKHLEVSERTIYRDLEALSIAGIPVYTERGPGGGCSLVDGYQTRLTGLTEVEVRALFLFSTAGPLADLGLGKALEDALLKLEAALPSTSRDHAEQVRQRFHLDATWWYHPDKSFHSLQAIQDALWQNHKLYLVYQVDDGGWGERLVEPYGLVAKAGIWYLVGSCEGAYSVFRVSRILSATLLEEQFIRPERFDLASFWADYCAQWETEHPSYAVPLRLAPEEASGLPHLLSEWGYRLVEDEELPEADARVLPMHRNNQKQVLSYHVPDNVHKEKKLFVLSQSGEWLAIEQRGREKRRNSGFVRKPSGASSSKKKGVGAAKKKLYCSTPRKKMVSPKKKNSVLGHIKKQHFMPHRQPQRIKKRNFHPLQNLALQSV